jgi:hypothetical protein
LNNSPNRAVLSRVQFGEKIMKNAVLKTITAGAILALSLSAQEGKIAERKENQQDRIAQGVKSGQLTPRETVKLEKKEVAINKEVRADRKANGGKLTAAEKKQVNRQQNKVSKQIYAQKHDAQTQVK